MMGFVQYLACLVLSAVIVSGFEPQTCSKASDCAPDECCRIGMERFSVPTCMPFGQTGDTCLVGNQPEDKELYYPNGEILQVFQVYRLFCPCSKSLSCVRNQCVGV